MSIGPSGGIAGSAAGAPFSQTQGSEIERNKKDAATQQRQVDADRSAEQAAGVGQTEQDEQASERDADGRRLWEAGSEAEKDDAEQAETPRRSKDATGQSGNSLDLSG